MTLCLVEIAGRRPNLDTNVDHRNDINKFYDNITESMSKASEAIFDNNNCAGTNRRNDTHSIPGRNEHVDELHNIARVPNYNIVVRIMMYWYAKQCVYDGLELCRKAFM